MSKKSFSVIIPTYNSEKYIEKCIDSLITQNYDLNLIQILIIDDGSTDDIKKVVTKYKNQKCVEYHKKQNGQWGSVMNYVKHHKLAKHNLISILDADDFLDTNAFKTINENILDADLFVGAYTKWDGQKARKKIRPYWFLFTRTITNRQKMNTPFCAPLVFFVKSEIFYKTADLKEGVPYQDPDLISQFVMHSQKMRFSKKTIGYYYYNRQGNSISKKWNDFRFNAELNACLNCIRNDAQEIVSYRLNLKSFYSLCKSKGIKFNINRKMQFKWFPWYLRIFYWIVHKIKFAKFFELSKN